MEECSEADREIGFTTRDKQGWEDKLQKQFEAMAKEEFGIEIDSYVAFDG